jgi:hypothetical protein
VTVLKPGGLRSRRGQDREAFIAALRGLKERSGLTYRQLEERAAQVGDALPRSTVSDVLNGTRMPSADLVAAFVRTCGDGGRVEEWIASYQQVAGQQASGQVARPPARRRSVLLLTSAVVVLLAAGGAASWAWWPDGDQPAASSSGSVPKGPVQIRPAGADGLCLTEGRVDRYKSVVAVQRPCTDVAPQKTTLEAVADNVYRIHWYKPDQGDGCLTVLETGPGQGLLEPRDDCGQGTWFRMEAAGDGRYKVRVGDEQCLTTAGADAGTEATLEPCRKGVGQIFSVRKVD